MAGTIVIQAAVEDELEEEAQSELKQKIEDSLDDLEEIDTPSVFYKEETGTSAFGFVVDSKIEKLAAKPGNGRYLAIFIQDDEGEIISEKFILNPALRMERGRFGMAMSIFQRNGVRTVFLPSEPSRQEKMILEEIGLGFWIADFKTLEELRKNPDKLSER